MTTALQVKQTDIISINHFTESIRKTLPGVICGFLDMAQTATSRATHYNKKKDQDDGVSKLHKQLLQMDRGVYGLCLLMPGITDYTKQMGTGFLLDNPRKKDAIHLLNTEQEAMLLNHLIRYMEPQKLFKLYGELRKNRVNNSRTKKMMLRSILSAPKLDYWSIKYRHKLYLAVEHAWDKSTTGILRSILSKKYGAIQQTWNEKERKILKSKIDKYTLDSRFQPHEIYESVAFILGLENRMTQKLHKAYKAARTDLDKGKGIPKENLFYLRSRFHKDVDKAKVYDLTKKTMTSRQKLQTQKAAKKVGVEIEFDPIQSDSVRLYLYAYEMGMTDKIQKALDKKAEIAARTLPTTYKKIGILIDASESHKGDKTQALRPIAISMATRDMLIASAEETHVEYANGHKKDGMIRPSGETSLGLPLIKLLKKEPDAIYVFSDGYENAPSGEFSETMNKVRKLGITTPVYHLAPVFAAESGGIRELSKDVTPLPVSKPEGIGNAMLRNVIKADLDKGLMGVAKATLPRLGYKIEDGGE